MAASIEAISRSGATGARFELEEAVVAATMTPEAVRAAAMAPTRAARARESRNTLYL